MFTKSLSVLFAISLGKPSRTLVLAALVLALTAMTADARRHGRHHHGYGFPRHGIERIVPAPPSFARGSYERRQFDRRSIEGTGFDRRGLDRAGGTERGNILALVPADWRQQPPDPNWEGQRYVSPEGNAWLAMYGRPAAEEPHDQHLKAVAFVDGEDVTYLQRERDWLAVSGFKGDKGDRIFYRKVVLACGQRQWRHIALEYPAEAKRAFDGLVTSFSHALDRARDDNCEDPTIGRR